MGPMGPSETIKLIPVGYRAPGTDCWRAFENATLRVKDYEDSLFLRPFCPPVALAHSVRRAAVYPGPDTGNAASVAGSVCGAPESHMQAFHPVLIVTGNSPLKKPYERKSIQVLATHMGVEPSATSAEDYLKYSQKTAKENGMAVTYKGSPRPMTINDQSFARAEMQLSINGGKQHAEQCDDHRAAESAAVYAGESR